MANWPDTSPAKPAARFGTSTVSAAIFRERVATKKGDAFEVFNIDLRRSYKKADGSFGNSHTLRAGDLDAAIAALGECKEYVASHSSDGK